MDSSDKKDWSSSSKDWSNSSVLEFLKLYCSERVIWDPKHPLHKNRTALEIAWMHIVDNMSVPYTIEELKKKKDSLMATFRKLSRRKAEMAGGGSKALEDFRPDWFAYEFMETFLGDVYKPKPVQASELSEDNFDADLDDELQDPQGSPVTIEQLIKLEPHSPTSDDKSSYTHFRPNNTNTNESRPIRKRRRTRLVPNLQKPQAIDECLLYSKLVAKKLKRLDERTREKAMLEIDFLLFKLKYQNGREAASTSGTSLFSTRDNNFELDLGRHVNGSKSDVNCDDDLDSDVIKNEEALY